MSMKQHIRDIYLRFLEDEQLLRLLYYPPKNGTKTPDPLSPALPDITKMDIDKLWEIRDDRILMTPKTDDLKTPKCRLLFYAGRRQSTNGNFYFSNQEIICDVFCHYMFEKDQRSMAICDRINEILFNERITGIGKVLFKQGGQIGGVNDYVGYKLVFEICSENY